MGLFSCQQLFVSGGVCLWIEWPCRISSSNFNGDNYYNIIIFNNHTHCAFSVWEIKILFRTTNPRPVQQHISDCLPNKKFPYWKIVVWFSYSVSSSLGIWKRWLSIKFTARQREEQTSSVQCVWNRRKKTWNSEGDRKSSATTLWCPWDWRGRGGTIKAGWRV